ncbi:MAG: hypothetical protein IJD79_00650 [Clostridia bacterium]|nr:hypothetical protein [Clostridia bacterium]
MGRKKIYNNWNHPQSLVNIIETIISDYPRRDRIVRFSSASETVIEEYRRLNAIIDRAVNELEPELARIVKCDMIDRIGYDKSRASLCASKSTYYNRKRKLIHDIAVYMCLVDAD